MNRARRMVRKATRRRRRKPRYECLSLYLSIYISIYLQAGRIAAQVRAKLIQGEREDECPPDAALLDQTEACYRFIYFLDLLVF